MNKFLNRFAILTICIINSTLFGLHHTFIPQIPQVNFAAFAEPTFLPMVRIDQESIKSFDMIKFLQSDHISSKNRVLAKEFAEQLKKDPAATFLANRFLPLAQELCYNFAMYQIPVYRDFIVNFPTVKSNFLEISKKLYSDPNFYSSIFSTCKNSSFNTIDFIFCGGKIPEQKDIPQSLCSVLDQSLIGASMGCRHFILSHLKYGDQIILPLHETDKIHIVEALPAYQFSEFLPFNEKITQNASPRILQAYERVQKVINPGPIIFEQQTEAEKVLSYNARDVLRTIFSYQELIAIEDYITNKNETLLSCSFLETRKKFLTSLETRAIPELEKIAQRLPFHERLSAESSLASLLDTPKVQQKFAMHTLDGRPILDVWKERTKIAQQTKSAFDKITIQIAETGSKDFKQTRTETVYKYIERCYQEKYDGLKSAFVEGTTDKLIEKWAYEAYMQYLATHEVYNLANINAQIEQMTKNFTNGFCESYKQLGIQCIENPFLALAPIVAGTAIALGLTTGIGAATILARKYLSQEALKFCLPIAYKAIRYGGLSYGIFKSGYKILNSENAFECGKNMGDLVTDSLLIHYASKFSMRFIADRIYFSRLLKAAKAGQIPEFDVKITLAGSLNKQTPVYQPAEGLSYWNNQNPCILVFKTPIKTANGIYYQPRIKALVQNNKPIQWEVVNSDLTPDVRNLLTAAANQQINLTQPSTNIAHAREIVQTPALRAPLVLTAQGMQTGIENRSILPTFTNDPSYVQNQAATFLDTVKNCVQKVKDSLHITADGNTLKATIGEFFQISWVHNIANKIANHFGVSVDTVKPDLFNKLCDFKKLPINSRTAIQKSDLTFAEKIQFLSGEIPLSAELKVKIANDPYIRLDEQLSALTSRWNESPLRKYEQELISNAYHGSSLSAEQQARDQHSIAIAQDLAQKLIVKITDTKSQPCRTLLEILKDPTLSPATLDTRAKAVERLRYDQNFDINHPEFLDVRLDILTQTNNWHNKDFWNTVSVFKETPAFKKASAERLLTDHAFHHELVNNSPNGHTACALLHSHDHALPGNALSSKAQKILTQHALLNPQELCHFDAYSRSKGSLETPLSDTVKQKIVANHEVYQDKAIWDVIKDWSITRGEIVRTKNQLLEDNNYVQQQSRLKGPDGSTFDSFVKREAEAIERACYSSPNEIEFGSSYQLGKYQNAIKQYQLAIPTFIPASTTSPIPAQDLITQLSPQAKHNLVNLAKLRPTEVEAFEKYLKAPSDQNTSLSENLQAKIAKKYVLYQYPEIWHNIKNWPTTQKAIVHARNKIALQKNEAQKPTGKLWLQEKLDHVNAPDGKVKLVEFIQKQAAVIEEKLPHTEKLKIVVQHEIDVNSQKLDFELLNNRKQAIANTVKDLLGKHQDANLKKECLDLVTDYANELTQPKCEKHGIPTQRKAHALTIDKISEIINNDQDWDAIAEVCDNVATIPGTETSVFFDYEHIFSPILKIDCKNKIVTNSGFHHDEDGKLQDSDLLEIRNEIPYEGGFYEYEWRLKGSNSEFKKASFFPKHWSKLAVMDAINDALKNPFEQSQLTTKYEIKGRFDNKYEFLISINKNGRSITAFPLTKNLKKL